ncbi:DsbA family oxidoreductase [Cellvibrio sp. pealriver]|uniref:DsbA family oxidoreductase n=1 Tax=Cellvibrio sp. pealriver TaxID=1622269 RepID=UPI00066FB336|nr:DsbA family oxidoreductase [Cellvibrio sp. pealriver]
MLRIDFISDINCPWCALGLAALDAAIQQLGAETPVEIHCQPFELNPQLPAGGVKLKDYLQQKYGMGDAQIRSVHDTIAARGSELQFTFAEREFLWNSFDCHRLLYWAEQEYSAEKQVQLKRALMQAYQGEGRNISQTEILVDVVGQAGLDKHRAETVLASNEFTQEVRTLQQTWINAGISAVPSLVINRQHLLQGAQSPDVYAQALRDIAQQQNPSQ